MKFRSIKPGAAATEGVFSALVLSLVSFSALADMSNLVERVHVDAKAEFSTAYCVRAVVIDSRPLLSTSADLLLDLDPLGYAVGGVWSGSAVSRGGQSFHRRNAFNETYYYAGYGYDLGFSEDWKLRNFVARGWDTLPGYFDEYCRGYYEWMFGQSLENPYATPYYLARRGFQRGEGWLWEVGLKRDFDLTERLVLSVNVFVELSDGRHQCSAYGANPHSEDGRYPDAAVATDVELKLSYWFTDWACVYAFVHQFDVISRDLREAADWYHDTYNMPESLSDLTYGGIGLRIRF